MACACRPWPRGLRTNLLPREITIDRLVRRKKPWAVPAAALVLLACTVSYAAYAMQFNAVKPTLWDEPMKQADTVQGDAKRLQGQLRRGATKYKETRAKGEKLVSNVQDRDQWLEFPLRRERVPAAV